jgi:hypothetical protein
MRHEQPGRAAVLRLQWLTLVLIDNPRPVTGDALKRDVRGVATIAEGQHTVRRCLGAIKEGLDGDAAPRRLER